MTKLEMLRFGMQHIAENHHADCIDSIEEDGTICILNGNVPTVADVKFLAADLGLTDCVYPSEYGVEIDLDDEEWNGEAEYVQPAHEFWRRNIPLQ